MSSGQDSFQTCEVWDRSEIACLSLCKTRNVQLPAGGGMIITEILALRCVQARNLMKREVWGRLGIGCMSYNNFPFHSINSML